MPFITGSAADQAALLTTLRSAATANGYTLDGNIVKKGNLHLNTYNSATGGEDSALVVWMGKGSASGALTDAFQYGVTPNRSTVFRCAYPVTYDIHVHDDELFMVWWDANEKYFWLAWGQSSPFSDTPGAGNSLWCGGTQSTCFTINSGTYYDPDRWINIGPDFGGTTTGVSTEAQQCTSPALFWHTHQPTVRGFSNTIYTDTAGAMLGGRGTVTDSTDDYVVTGIRHLAPLIARQPNTWNGETVLLPICCYTPVASLKQQLEIQVKHARYCRLNNLDPRTVITVGGQDWKVYPWFKLDRTTPNGSASGSAAAAIDHTGTFGWAVKYDGP